MNLRDRDAYRDAAWDWSILAGCFGGNIRPTDIDGCVERKRHFLFIEAKPKNGVLNQGQTLAFARLANQPNTTVLFIYGPNGEPEETSAIGAFQPHGRQPADINSLRVFCQAWYAMADSDMEVS